MESMVREEGASEEICMDIIWYFEIHPPNH